ncbi:MAG: DUF742 domain-containing protein [Streptosporangiaceae bacterium]|jgi:hypothetical protein
MPGRLGRRDTGPVVRPYAVTGGRTEPDGGEVLDLLTLVVTSGQPTGHRTPEHRKILSLCERPARLADISSDLRLPVGVVRVLLADLTSDGSISVVRQQTSGQQPGNDVLKEILRGLRAL